MQGRHCQRGSTCFICSMRMLTRFHSQTESKVNDVDTSHPCLKLQLMECCHPCSGQVFLSPLRLLTMLPTTDTQKCIWQVILNPIKLTININYHKFIHPQKASLSLMDCYNFYFQLAKAKKKNSGKSKQVKIKDNPKMKTA